MRENNDTNEGVSTPDFADALSRLERATGAPVPSGNLRLWTAEINGALQSVKRLWPGYAQDLRRFRDGIGKNDSLRFARAQALERATAEIENSLRELVKAVGRLAHTRRPDAPAEYTAAEGLRRDLLGWIVDVRATRREHEEWHARSLQVDIGGSG